MESSSEAQLLRDYRSRLDAPEEKMLSIAIDRVLRIFESRNYKGIEELLDFYHNTLMNSAKSTTQKTVETMLVGTKWDRIDRGLEDPTESSTVSPTSTGLLSNYLYTESTTLPKGGGSPSPRAISASNRKLESSSPSLGGTGGRSSPRKIAFDENSITRSRTPSPTKWNVSYSSQVDGTPEQRRVQQSSYYESSDGTSVDYTTQVLQSTFLQTGDMRSSSPSRRTPSPSSIKVSNLPASVHQHLENVQPSTSSSPQPPPIIDPRYLVGQEVLLKRGRQGFGIGIAGGSDQPSQDGRSTGSIFINKLVPGGPAAKCKRLVLGDVIVRINDTWVVDVPHETAVNALKSSPIARLSLRPRGHEPNGPARSGSPIRSYSPAQQQQQQEQGPIQDLIQIQLQKPESGGLGFSVGGGSGNQQYPGDNGIYITKVVDGGPAGLDGRLGVGDKLVAIRVIQGEPNSGVYVERNMENITHEEAVATLRGIGIWKHVVLLVRKSMEPQMTESRVRTPSPAPPPPGAYSSKLDQFQERSGSPNKEGKARSFYCC